MPGRTVSPFSGFRRLSLFTAVSAGMIGAFTGTLVVAPATVMAQTAKTNAGPQSEAAHQYAACLKLARLKPQEGYDSASQWADLGGGEPAKHCAAVALIGLGDYTKAATQLDNLADNSASTADIVAGFLGQAAQAWTMVNNLQFAWRDQTRALKLIDKDPSLWVDRAVTLGMAGQYWEAIDDLNKALDLDPKNVDALVYRGSAWRALETYDLARADIDRALELQPDHLQARLESGNLYRIAGNKEAARQDWLAVIEQGDGTPAAKAARDNIEKMDVESENGNDKKMEEKTRKN
ncbi:tetratricopeptide repeat protein [Thalassospira sp.]|uniref:tetratricopeptide repeat protein n=1 Tax=Thalassospira sp. TaxID=1912094 RepID=UPI003AA8B9C6